MANDKNHSANSGSKKRGANNSQNTMSYMQSGTPDKNNSIKNAGLFNALNMSLSSA
jgi:hypothetical protein